MSSVTLELERDASAGRPHLLAYPASLVDEYPPFTLETDSVAPAAPSS